MKKSWFRYPDCTAEEVEALTKHYKSRNIPIETTLNPDFKSWCVCVFLETEKHEPMPSRIWQSALGRAI